MLSLPFVSLFDSLALFGPTDDLQPSSSRVDSTKFNLSMYRHLNHNLSSFTIKFSEILPMLNVEIVRVWYSGLLT